MSAAGFPYSPGWGATQRPARRRGNQDFEEMSEPTPNPFDPFFDAIRRIVREEIKAASNGNGHTAELFTPEELAEKLKVPRSWVYEQSRQGNIPTHRTWPRTRGQRERAKATLDLIATCSEIIEGVEPSWFVASGH
jgi:hypothetical protein